MGLLDGWRFCPRCGGEASIDGERLRCGVCGHVVWATPSLAACALCEDEARRVLLVRREHQPSRGKWDAPGGFVGEGEHPVDALRREVREETGLEVDEREFIGAWVDDYVDEHAARKVVVLYWRVAIVGGGARAGDDAAEVRWFARNELPSPDDLAFPNVIDVVAAWAEA
jgi:ADP-ribose pyrophosphatase YjhB (NUDIX family)